MPFRQLLVRRGAAGLSAALMLSRARRRVLVLDDGTPRNAPAHGVHNWLTGDGDQRPGGRDDRRRGAFTAWWLLVTTGLTDEIPPVDGLVERWGSDVFACPFCPDDEQWHAFAACRITVVDGEVTGTVVDDGRLTGRRPGPWYRSTR